MKTFLKFFWGFIIILICGGVILGIWLYRGPLTSSKIKFFSHLPLPMATVNGNFIPVSEFIKRYNFSQSLAPQASQNEIEDQLIKDEEADLVAESNGVSVSQKQIEQDYQIRSTSADLEGQKNFEGLLKTYGLSTDTYKSEIIRPQLLMINLQTWFYSQTGLNPDAYAQANALVQKIQKGDNIGLLAAANSQQSSDVNTQGDLGFISVTDLLPELREQADSMSVGEIKILPSRYGLHILELEEKNNNQVHFRQIFLNGSNFQVWYNSQIKNYKVHQLIKI